MVAVGGLAVYLGVTVTTSSTAGAGTPTAPVSILKWVPLFSSCSGTPKDLVASSYVRVHPSSLSAVTGHGHATINAL